VFADGDHDALRRAGLFFWMLTNKQNSLKHGYITAYPGWATVVDTVTTATDAMWERVIKGMGEAATSGDSTGAQYTKDSRQIKAPPATEETSKIKEMTAIPVELRKSAEAVTNPDATPLAATRAKLDHPTEGQG